MTKGTSRACGAAGPLGLQSSALRALSMLSSDLIMKH